MKQLPATLLYCSCQYMRILDRSLRTACGTRQANREAIKPTVAWACELSLDDILRPYLPSLARPVRLSAWASKGSSIGICQFNMQLCVGHMSKTAAVTSCGLLRVTSGHRTCDSRWQFFDRDEGIVLISRSASLVMQHNAAGPRQNELLIFTGNHVRMQVADRFTLTCFGSLCCTLVKV